MNDYEYSYGTDPELAYKSEYSRLECYIQRKWGYLFSFGGIGMITSNAFPLLGLEDPSSSGTNSSMIYAVLGILWFIGGLLTIRASYQPAIEEAPIIPRKSFLRRLTKIELEINYVSSLYPLLFSCQGFILAIPAYINIFKYISNNSYLPSQPWPDTILGALWLLPTLFAITLSIDYLKATRRLNTLRKEMEELQRAATPEVAD